ncbi:Vgb family protein [Streptomyces boluensis]|uniref:Virginiamycin B lyase n=1 Tax=Streptomyces boluensis TaxID=1775135 RepID=A0A964UT98_9ACTN|nr:hypothetical protein [Streptomyces boluensis]NBE52562.1 hypothetical protein [Streptomyces boluensis]
MRNGRRLCGGIATAAVMAASLLVTPAGASPGGPTAPGRLAPPSEGVREYPLPQPRVGTTHELIAGPDGNLWITQPAQDRVLRVSPSGATVGVVNFPKGSAPHGIDKDRRGHVWVTEEHSNTLVELDASGNRLSRHRLPVPDAGPHGLRIGCDGRTVWWTGKANGTVGSFHPRTGTWQVRRLAPNSQPIYLARGPRCSMWFTELTGNRIGRVNASGAVREYRIPTPDSRPIAIAADRRGHMWFTEEAGRAYAELAPASGRITEHRTDVPGAKMAGLAFDGCGDLWVQYNEPGLIDRVRPHRPSDAPDRYRLSTTTPIGHRIIPGNDGSMWFTELGTDTLGSVPTGCPAPRPS